MEHGPIKVIYCHTSPNFLVSPGDYVENSQVIGEVGPFNVYDVINNPYKDKNGNPTNGSLTGTHLHFGIKVNGDALDPLSLLKRGV